MGIISYAHQHITTGLVSAAETLTLNGMDWLGPVFANLVVIYLAVWGYLLWAGVTEQPLRDSIFRFLRIGLVSTFALGTTFYNAHIMELAFNGPGEIANAISGTPTDAVHQIDRVWVEMRFKADEAMSAGGLTNITGYIVGILLLAATFIFCLPVFLLITVSQIMTALLIVVGPFYIAAALFKRGVPAFQQWVGQLLTYFLMYVLAMVLMYLAIETVVELMRNGIATRSPDLGTASEVLFMAFMMLYAISMIPSMAGSLAGSMSAPVDSVISKAARTTRGAVNSTGQGTKDAFRRSRADRVAAQARAGIGRRAAGAAVGRGKAMYQKMNANSIKRVKAK